MASHPDDEEEFLLIGLVQNGDLKAFERLLRRLHGPLRSYVTKMVGDSNADDVLQEISLRIFQHLRFLRDPRAFRAWVYSLSSRIVFRHLGRERRWRQFEADGERMNEVAAEEPLPDVGSDVLDMIEHVSPASRAVLLLHYQQQLSLEETAAVLAIPVGTAKSRLAYGVATIRKRIKEKESQ